MAITTLALGEEGGDFSTGPAELAAPTTMATGEEGPDPITTMATGEEDRTSSEAGVVNPFGAF